MSLLEKLADLEHKRWSGWQGHLHGKCKRLDDGSLVIPASYVRNLERLMYTDYKDLVGQEKESDRVEAAKTLKVIEECGE